MAERAPITQIRGTEKRSILEGETGFETIYGPTLKEVRVYFSEKEMPEAEADAFFALKEKNNWTGKKGKKLSQWKGEAFRWIAIVMKKQPWLFSRKAR